MKYKMICSDLDDTLLSSDMTISDKLKHSIKKYVDSGGKFVIATGRMTFAALPIAKILELHGEIITFQGAIVADIDTGKQIDNTPIKNEDAVKICQIIEATGHYFQTYADNIFITQKAGEFTEMYASLCGCKYIESKIPLSDYLKNSKISPPKIVVFGQPNEVPFIIENLRKQLGERYLVNTSKPWLVEIISRDINKAIAVKKLSEKYNIKREEIICIGDSANDAPMLDFAGLGIAVSNCTAAAKKVANVIAPSCDEDGVAWVIDNYGFIKA